MQPINQIISKNLNMTTDFEMRLVREYRCEGCGNLVKVYRMKYPVGPKKGQWFEGKKGCDCELLEIVRREQAEANAARMKRIFEENSLINPSLREASFENFEPGEFREAYERAKKYVEEFDINKPKNLLFQGTFGTGKSHLSVSIAKAIAQKGYSSIFISTPKLLTKIRNTYNKDSELSEEQVINALANADLVVFDDIGAEGMANEYGKPSSWALQKIFEIIDQRSGKHNIFTTNLSSAEFEATKDLQRIFSRMMMNSEPIIMNGPDYRKRKFLREAKGNV